MNEIKKETPKSKFDRSLDILAYGVLTTIGMIVVAGLVYCFYLAFPISLYSVLIFLGILLILWSLNRVGFFDGYDGVEYDDGLYY